MATVDTMPYASGRTFLDADSHVMELPDFLTSNADPGIRDRIPEIPFESGGESSAEWETAAKLGAHPPERVEELIAMGDGLVAGPKGYRALGAFNASERTAALDQLGFDKQLVFATFSAVIAFDLQADLDLRYGAARAHNRSMAEFCSADRRMIGVALLPLDDPDRTIEEFEYARELGLGAMWVPHRPPGNASPGHNRLDPVWARLAEAGIPAVLHVGGNPLQTKAAWMDTGRPVPTDWLGGGENIRGKDMIGLHHAAESFVGTMVLDGVLQRHPGLRVGVVELGAAWVPSMIRRLDQIAEIWKRSEPDLAALVEKPSEQIARQMAFTPYPVEDGGARVRDSNPDLYMFSSDYPHIEGGRNPLGRFGSSLDGFGEDVLDRFYSGNMGELIG